MGLGLGLGLLGNPNPNPNQVMTREGRADGGGLFERAAIGY